MQTLIFFGVIFMARNLFNLEKPLFLRLFAFCYQNPIERLGCHPQTGFADITTHVFFRTVDWEQVGEGA